MRRISWKASVCILVLIATACASQFREPLKLSPTKTVDVVGLHWQVTKTLGRPLRQMYVVTYVTKLPFERAVLKPEADQVMQHFASTLPSSYNILVIQAITEPTGGFVKRFNTYNFEYVRTHYGWVER